jgi:DNA modification methylase
VARSSKFADSSGLSPLPARRGNRNRPQADDPGTPSASHRLHIEYWPVERLNPYERNPRKNDKAVDRIRASIREFGFAVPILAKSDGEVVDGHLRLKGAIAEKMREVPVIPCDGWSDAQVKAFRLLANRSVGWAEWDLDALALEFAELKTLEFDLSLTGFDSREIDAFTFTPDAAEDDAPPVPEVPTSRPGDLWLCGPHRVFCGDTTQIESVALALGAHKPFLMVTDPPYGVELDMEWRDRAGHNEMGPAAKSYMKQRIEGHTATTISGDTKADWSDAFALVPTLDVVYVWHATSHLVEVAVGLDRIGFHVRQQLIWNKTAAAMSRQAYHWKHEPCWYAVRRGKTAHWLGSRDQSTIWDAASPKMIMGGSTEEKQNHPTQKPIELMRRPILNHTKRGDVVWEPFLGSGTTLAAAESIGRVCCGIEIEPRFVDQTVMRWEKLTGKHATLEADGRTFGQVKAERIEVAA